MRGAGEGGGRRGARVADALEAASERAWRGRRGAGGVGEAASTAWLDGADLEDRVDVERRGPDGGEHLHAALDDLVRVRVRVRVRMS